MSTEKQLQSTNSKDVFYCLFNECRYAIISLIVNLVKDKVAAEDISQDVFLKFWQLKDEYNTFIEDPKSYLFRMARNAAINYLRKENLRRQMFSTLPKTAYQNLNLVEQILYQKELEALLQQAVHQLSPGKKKIYLFCKIEGLNHKKAALLLGKSPCTVKETMRLSNQQIRKYINSQMDFMTKTRQGITSADCKC